MSRYIDADALIDFIDVGHLRHPSELCLSEIDVVNLLLHAPTADVAPVIHARWVKRGCKWQCTHCKVLMSIEGTPKENLLNYCPNCGAKMDEECK